MANKDNLVLKIQELIKKSRAALLDRGVQTDPDITLNGAIEKIKDIPIYQFHELAQGSGYQITMIPKKPPVAITAKQSSIISSVESVFIENIE